MEKLKLIKSDGKKQKKKSNKCCSLEISVVQRKKTCRNNCSNVINIVTNPSISWLKNVLQL